MSQYPHTNAAVAGSLAMLALAACAPQERAPAITPEEARAIAREAYTYGYPMVDGYRIQHAYFVDRGNPEYKGEWNAIHSVARVFTPDDKAVQTPNSDTPYSLVGLDLRAEPIVLTVPPIDSQRYYSVQLIDTYTHNFAYIGSRATGNGAGSFLVAGPGWQGDTPAGIAGVIRSETQLVLAIYRTQLLNPADLENVKKVQAGYTLQPLSAFLGQAAPHAAPAIDFIAPLTPATLKTSLEFFQQLNFVLQFCPTVPSETELMARFARIGVGAGKRFDPATLAPEMAAALQAGMADASSDLGAVQAKIAAGEVQSGDLFGTREFLKNNYAFRMAGAVLGIYGNSKQEAMYPVYLTDGDGQKLDGANRYTLRFGPDELPPVNAFWSLTMYEMPASLLTANPINRYLINSPMLPQLRRDADGGVTILIQHESPGKAREANWLPAPAGPFIMALRLYWPKPEALEGQWKAPPVKKAA
jgi:hypothetical protein